MANPSEDIPLPQDVSALQSSTLDANHASLDASAMAAANATAVAAAYMYPHHQYAMSYMNAYPQAYVAAGYAAAAVPYPYAYAYTATQPIVAEHSLTESVHSTGDIQMKGESDLNINNQKGPAEEEDEEDDEDDDPTIDRGQKSTKASNVLPIWGNEKTMNLNSLILTNIQQSPYFKVNLYQLKTYHEVIDEIYYHVKHLEPWERGSRKVSCEV